MNDLRSRITALTMAFAATMPVFAAAAPAPSEPATTQAAPAASAPADPELAAKVKEYLAEDERIKPVESPRTQAEKDELAAQLTNSVSGAPDNDVLLPGQVAGLSVEDQAGIQEFLDDKDAKMPTPVPMDASRPMQAGPDGKPVPQELPLTPGQTTPPQGPRDVDKWVASRPEEKVVSAALAPYLGRNLVAVDIDGAGDETALEARKAILSRSGDIFNAEAVEKDRDSIYNTGLFYDIYPTFREVPEGVVITYHVIENPTLNELIITGNTVMSYDRIFRMLDLEPGKVLNTRKLHENVQAVDAKYHEEGYILVKIGELEIDKQGNLHIDINEGTLEGYVVKGNSKTRDKVILREMRQKPGQPFNAKKARRGMQRIYNLGYFEDVNMKLQPGYEPNAVILEVDVVEKRSGNFTIGAGYSSRDGIIGLVGIGDNNFLGTGDAINFTYEFSADSNDSHGWMFSYRKPWLTHNELAALVRLYDRTYRYYDYNTQGHEIESYMRKYVGGELQLSQPTSEFSTFAVTFKNREEDYTKHRSGLDRSGADYADWRKRNFGTTRSIILDRWCDHRDNMYSPTKGSRQSISIELAGWGADFNFQKYTFDDQHYFKVGHAQVLAFHAQYGYGKGNINETNEYRIGGQGSVRGYKDDQFRGKKTTWGTLEYRMPLVKKVDLALFTDFGTAWTGGGFFPKGWHQSIGAGISMNTPMGPIRLDYGYGSQGGRVHFSMGGSF